MAAWERRVNSTSAATATSLTLAPPCVVIHAEESQVRRFVSRISGLDPTLRLEVAAVASPLIYVRSPVADQSALHKLLQRTFAGGRITAHRIYRLDWSCNDLAWLLNSAPVRELIECHDAHCVIMRVVAFPRQLQTKVTNLLASAGFAVHPTRYTHELHVTHQPNVSCHFLVGISTRLLPAMLNRNGIYQSSILSVPLQVTPTISAEAPCRAYFKMSESLQYITMPLNAHVLDVGASPGGWTDCLVQHGARVVAVDPGELKIPLKNRPIMHIRTLLEAAIVQLKEMEQFTLCVCDINVRVQKMARLMLQVAPLLSQGGRVIFTLKLGKRPTEEAVVRAFELVKEILQPGFTDFQLIWLHANTQNERTLLATRA